MQRCSSCSRLGAACSILRVSRPLQSWARGALRLREMLNEIGTQHTRVVALHTLCTLASIFLLLASRRILAGAKLARRLKLGPLRRLASAIKRSETAQHIGKAQSDLPVARACVLTGSAGHTAHRTPRGAAATTPGHARRAKKPEQPQSTVHARGALGKNPKIPDVGDRTGAPGASR